MQAEVFMLPIDRLTPSQLYISEKKLAGVRAWFDGNRLSDSIRDCGYKRLYVKGPEGPEV